MEPSASHDRPGEIAILESKVVLALSRLQKGRYPSRQGKSGGIASKQVAIYLANNYCYLDGDIESQVMTALLSCVKAGLICALNNGKFRLLNPNTKNMASTCVTRTRHGPECTCLNLITSIRKNSYKTCCSYNVDGTKIIDNAVKGSDNEQPKRRKSVTKKPLNRAKLKVKRQTRRKRVLVKCIQREEKALENSEKAVNKKKEVTPPVVEAGGDKKIRKCKYCFARHSRPDNSGKKLCQKCHPPGTRYGVPHNKFSPREEVIPN